MHMKLLAQSLYKVCIQKVKATEMQVNRAEQCCVSETSDLTVTSLVFMYVTVEKLLTQFKLLILYNLNNGQTSAIVLLFEIKIVYDKDQPSNLPLVPLQCSWMLACSTLPTPSFPLLTGNFANKQSKSIVLSLKHHC